MYVSLRESIDKASQDAFDEYVSLLLLLKLIQKERVLSKAATSVLCELLSCIISLQQHSCFQSCLYTLSHLPLSETVNAGLKFELLHYAVVDGNHVLSLRCVTVQELDPEPLVPVVGHFMAGFFDRAVGVVYRAKRRYCTNPGMTVTWTVTAAEHAEDGKEGLRNEILKEMWNCRYDDCDWCRKKAVRSDYLDYLLRVTNSSTETRRTKVRRSSCDVDDIVFMKFSDKESKGSFPMLYSLLFLGLVLLLVLSCCFLHFFFPLIRFLSPVSSTNSPEGIHNRLQQRLVATSQRLRLQHADLLLHRGRRHRSRLHAADQLVAHLHDRSHHGVAALRHGGQEGAQSAEGGVHVRDGSQHHLAEALHIILLPTAHQQLRLLPLHLQARRLHVHEERRHHGRKQHQRLQARAHHRLCVTRTCLLHHLHQHLQTRRHEHALQVRVLA